MKTLIWKELRENGKWAALGMLVLGLAEFYGLSSNSSTDRGSTLCKDALLTATLWGCAVIGFILALIQILPEQRRDQWAALLHRPVRRETIFLSKILAGLSLYLCATLPPFLACAWYAFTPGHFPAPVVPGMMTPGLVDIVAGAMFYAAGLFVALRGGPWYGPRLLGAVGALIVQFITILALPSTSVLGLIAIMSGLLIIAARGTIQTNGPLSRMGLPGQAGNVLLSLLSFSLLPILIFLSIAWIAWLLFGSQVQVGSKYVIDPWGNPFIVTQTVDSTTATDLAGNVTKAPQDTLNLYPFVRFDDEGTPFFQAGLSADFYRFTSYYIETCDDTRTERWYFVKGEKKYVGYSLNNNLRSGSIGVDGYKGLPDHTKSFEAPARSWNSRNDIVQSGRNFYLVDFYNHKLSLIYTLTEGAKVYGLMDLLRSGTGQFRVAFALKDHFQLVDMWANRAIPAVSPPFSIPYDHDRKIWDSVSICVSDRYFILYYTPKDWDAKVDSQPAYLEKWDFHGKLIETTVLPHLKDSNSGQDWSNELLSEAILNTVGIADVLALVSYEKILRILGSKETGVQENGSWDGLWQMLLVSMVFAGITYFWARRMQFSHQRACAWTLLVLATNLAGFLTFRLISDWPQRVPCPICRKHRSVSELNCPHCKEAWPLPKRDGTEIFEPAEHQTAVLKS